MPSRIVRGMFVCLAAVCLSVLVFTGCGEKEEKAEVLLQKGIAAYESEDYKTAVDYFTKAAEQGDDEAQFCLAICYSLGVGVEADEEEALKWINSAAEHGNQTAKDFLDLGKLSEAMKNGDEETIREMEKAFLKDAYRKATEANDRDSQLWIAISSEEKGNLPDAVEWYRKAAEKGDHLAQYRLGTIFDKGESGVRQDKAEAVKWFRMGAEQDQIDCQYMLGLHYATGEGVERDLDEAAKWIRKSAESSQLDAMFKLGLMHRLGEGVEQNDYEAKKWIRKAANYGNEDAKKYLEEHGISNPTVLTTEDQVEGLRNAAEHGDAAAAFSLGYVNERGDDDWEKDYAEAAKWYRKAVELNGTLENAAKQAFERMGMKWAAPLPPGGSSN